VWRQESSKSSLTGLVDHAIASLIHLSIVASVDEAQRYPLDLAGSQDFAFLEGHGRVFRFLLVDWRYLGNARRVSKWRPAHQLQIGTFQVVGEFEDFTQPVSQQFR
jgi:hypothetical protein